MKKSIDTIGNRTRDLPACSTVPQPTVPPRVVFLFTNLLVSVHLEQPSQWGPSLQW